MPQLWTDTIDAHRRAVRDATLDATEALVRRGLRSATISQIAERAGIGKGDALQGNSEDVDAILVAWHERRSPAIWSN